MDTLADYDRWKSSQQQAGVGAAQVVLGSIEDAPDQVAGDLNLANEFGKVTGNPVPTTSLVKEYRSVFQQAVEREKSKTVLSVSPRLTEWLRNPENAGVSRDDLENLSWWETTLGASQNALSRFGQGVKLGANEFMAEQTAARARDRDMSFGELFQDARKTGLIGSDGKEALSWDGSEVFSAGMRWIDARYADLIGTDDKAAALQYRQAVGQIAKNIKNTVMSPAAERFKKVAFDDLNRAKPKRISDYDAAMFAWDGRGSPPEPVAAATRLEQAWADTSKFLSDFAADPSGATAFLYETALESIPLAGVAIAAGAITRSPAVGATVMGASSYAQERFHEPSEFFQSKGIDISTPEGAMRVLSDWPLMEEAQRRGMTRGAIIGVLDGLSGGVAGKALASSPLANMAIQSVVQAVMGGGGEAAAQLATNGAVDMREVIVEALAEFATSPIEVAGMGISRFRKERARARDATAARQEFEDISANAQASATRARTPDKFRQFVEAATANGPVENVFVPAETFAQYFQGVGVDPFALIEELDGVDADDLRAALTSGGDLRIPTATYAAKIAGSEHDAFFMDNMTFDPDGKTAAQAAEFNERADEIMRETWEAAEASRVEAEQYRAIEEQIFDSMVSRMRVAGQSTDVSTAAATLYPAFYRAMAERSGVTTDEFLGRYRLPEIKGDLPQGMQFRDVDELTRTLAEARTRKTTRESRTSLLEWISDYGGINDQGGELRARDAEVVRRGKGKKSLRLARGGAVAGMRDLLGATGGKKFGVDDVAQAAIEAGYLPDDPVANEYRTAMMEGREVPDISAALWDAIDRELRGQPEYAADQNAEADAQANAQFDEMEAYLSSLGVSLENSDAEIRQALEGAKQYAQVSPDQARAIDMAVELPTDPLFAEAVANTPGASITDDGLLIDLVRFQKPEQEGATSVRTGVFYLPVGSSNAKHYKAGGQPGQWYGGAVKVQGQTLVKRPLFVKGATGGKAPEAAYDAIKGKGAAKKLNDAARSAAVNPALRRDPGLFAENISRFLNEHGADGSMAYEIIENSKVGNQLTYALQENVVAHAVREAGYDAVIGYSKGKAGAFISEVFDVREIDYPTPGETATLHPQFERARSYSQDNRGVIQFLAGGVGNGDTVIRLFENSNLSTFLHESGHYFLTVMQDMAREGGPGFRMPQGVRIEEGQDTGRVFLDGLDEFIIGYNKFTDDNGKAAFGIGEVEVPENKRGQGLGIKAYEALVMHAFNSGASMVISDSVVSADAVRVYQSLERRGYKVEKAPEFEIGEGGNASGRGGAYRITGVPASKHSGVSADYEIVKSWWGENAKAVASDARRAMPDVVVTEADVARFLAEGSTGDVMLDGAIDVGMQEQFARGFEAYLMDGKAPSADLRGVFEKFRSWLISVYQKLAGLNVAVSDDMRAVFDRMLATDEEIKNAQADAGGNAPLFTSAEAMGLTPEDYAAFLKTRQQAEDDAKARLLRETMAPIKREREKWFKDERAKTREEVERNINALPYFRAIEWMGNRRWLGENQPEAMPDFRMSKSILVERYGEGVLKTLPRGLQTVYAVEGGVDPDDAAGWFGFASGDEMIRAMEKAPKRVEAIDAETDRVMRERHGDALNDGSVEAEALDAVHNDKRGQWLAAELKAVVEISGQGVGLTAKDALAGARQTIARMKVRDAMASQRFLAAERKAAEEAGRLGAMLAREGVWMQSARRRIATKARAAVRGEGTVDAVPAQVEQANASTGNYNETVTKLIDAKRRQLMNHALYMEARKVADEVEAAERFVAKLNKASTRERIAGAGRRDNAQVDYLAAIDEILTKYDFSRMTGRAERRRDALNAFVAAMKAEGRENEIAIPDAVMADADRKPYKTVPVEELRGVIASLKNLEHIAGRWNKLISAQRERDFQEEKAKIVQAVADNLKTKPQMWVKQDGVVASARDGLNGYLASFQTATAIIRQMDGREDIGPVYEALKSDIDDAAYTERAMRKEAAQKIEELYSVYSQDEQRQMGVRRVYNELRGRSFSKWNLIAMALNMGNEGNLDRLTNTRAKEHLTPVEVEAVKSLLDERDWKFVQSVWDYLNSFRPLMAERQRRVVGNEPAWVEPTPVVTPHGTFKGGYYPIKYAGHLGGGRLQMGDTDAEILQSMMKGGYVGAATKDGHLQERKSNVNQSLNLDVSIIGQHASEVIHDLAFSEAVVNSFRLLSSDEVRTSMINAGLDRQHEMLRLWVIDAASGQVAADAAMGRIFQKVRAGFSYSKLAWNVKTMIMQPLGVFQSAVAVGKANMAQQMVRYVANPKAMSEDVFARSRMMWERRETFNKDLMDVVAKSNIASPSRGKVRDAFEDYVIPAGMAGIQYVQLYTVDIPTWAAAFQKGMKQFAGDQDKSAQYADMTVNRTQGSGIWSDRSGIERGTLSLRTRQSPFVMLFTTLGSYFFAKMNMIIERTQGLRAEPITFTKAMDYAMDMMLLLAAESAVMTLAGMAMSDGDDGEDNPAGTIGLEAFKTFIAGLPVARDIAGMAGGFSPGTYASILGTVWEPMKQVYQGEADRAAVKSSVNLAGMLFRLPSTATNRVIDAAWRASEGEDVSPLEYLMGRSRK